MADRIPQYPMYSQGVMQNSVQQPTQPQMQQQSQQPQQPEPQMVQGLSNTDVRMWQMQMQNYRAQQSGDLTASQLNQQEYPRGQPFPQGQGQQPIVQQQMQTFGLHPQHVNPQGTSFHDPQGSQPQSHIPPGFAVNTPQMKPVPNRMTQQPMNTVLARQLQMIGQQNSASQQAPNQMELARSSLNAQHGAKQPGNGDMFTLPPNPDQMRGPPHSAAQQMGPPAGGQGPAQNGQRRLPSLAEINERRQTLQNAIGRAEQEISQLQASVRTGSIPEHLYQQRLPVLRNGLNARKDYLNKLNVTVAHYANQQMFNGMVPSNMPHMSSVGASSQPHPPGTGSTPPNQPGFVQQPNSTSPRGFGVNPSGNGPSPNNAHNPVPVNQLPVQPGQMGRPPGLPNRHTPAPHQLAGQVANAVSPNMGNGNQFAMQPANGQMATNQQCLNLMPLEKQRFESTYMQYCRSQRLEYAMHVAIAENRMVDLYQLHVEVIREGGHTSVTQRDLWAVIAGRLGFVQFSGDPPTSAPGIAQQVQHTYYEHLRQFESAYVMTMINRGANNQQQMGGLPPGGGGPKPPPTGQPTEAQPNNVHSSILPVLAQFAHLSVADMRAKNIPENMITIVETHRSDIIRWRHGEMMKRAANEQQGMPNPQGQPSAMPEQAGLGVPSGAQRPPQAMVPNPPSMSSNEQRPGPGQFAPSASQPTLLRSPTSEEVQHAYTTIASWRAVFANRSLGSMQAQHVPDEQRLEYNNVLEKVHKLTTELEPKLPMYFTVLRNEDVIRKCVAIVLTVGRQRQLLSTSSPHYIVTFNTLHNMYLQIQKINEEFEQRCRYLKTASLMQSNVPPGSVNRPTSGSHSTPLLQPNNLPSAPHRTPPSINRQDPHNPPSTLPPQPAQPQPQSQPQPPPKKPAQASVPPSPSNLPAATAVVTPPPAASTLAGSVATPQTQTAGSPQTPKSPKPKVGARPKVQPRIKKSSSSAKGAATPEATPAPVAGVKRPPEDDSAAVSALTPPEAMMCNAPSPKKVKTEWEGDPSEALLKRQQEIDNIKTEEDAMAFLSRVLEYANQDTGTHSDIAASLDLILAGVAQPPEDAAATAAAVSAHVARDPPPPTALSPYQGPAIDALSEFFDFSTFTTLDDEEESKPPTPDLVPSSEANPSPESGSDADLSGGSPGKTKNEDSTDHLSFLRLGALKEIDGGESAYYQMDNWKWAGEMPTLEQPWAMSTSS